MQRNPGMALTVLVIVTGMVGSAVFASPDTFSIDAISPSPNDPADLLDIGMSVQVPRINMGLVAGDELDAVSTGDDAVQQNNIAYFSVDRNSLGIPGPMAPLDVNGQALLNQQAGDSFVTIDAFGTATVPQGLNAQLFNHSFFGEIPVINPFVDNTGNPQDSLDALTFQEFDLTGDQLQDRPVYFSLAAGSPSLGAFSAADILCSPAGGGAPALFATAGQIGLDDQGDDLDALTLLDLDQNGIASLGDAALFSLAPGSVTLANLGASPADLFLTTFTGTNSLRYTAASLGLLFDDNVDALEVEVPEPGTALVLTFGAVALIRRRKQA